MKLPINKYARQIKDMVNGDIRWIVPWAISVDQNGDCWLNPNFTIHGEKMGTVDTEIQLKNKKYIITKWGNHKWIKENVPNDYFPISES